ncbi:MAG: asparagine synthase (glutamine-hydrolyzing) [Hyphomonadaceae bacterium]|nr:asparagine synthase (glutamine-hydrolyzing) [Hyphomonadaceae bacterium]
MCGIAGWAGPAGAAIDQQALAAMLAAIAHRGPDGDGAWAAPNGRAVFGHRRLAIIDLSDTAAQPMQDAQGAACLTYNGEIYNHRELRAELEAQGRLFKTDHSDTEVILQGYLAWGMDGLLARLNGIFAFALHDLRSGETYFVRDQVGVKPLYFAWARGGLAFASEIKALLALPGFRATLSPAAAYHYLTFMAAPAPLTMFEGVYKLPAGWLMRVDADGAAQARRYFAPWPSNALDTLPEKEREARVREVLRASVRRQLLADVPVGLFLSGGVDSTALLAIASEVNGAPPDTFSVGFDHETELDETAIAAQIAHRYGAKHTEVRIGAAEVITRIEQLVREQDEPLADWVCLPLRAVAHAAHEAGLKTVLCGEGADEQFCGYTHYLRYLDVATGPHKWFSALNALGVGAPVAQLASAVAGRNLHRAFRADFLRRAALGQEAFWGGAIVFSDGMKPAIWRGPAPGAPHDPRLAACGLGQLGHARHSAEVVDALLAPLDERHSEAELLQRMIWLEMAQRLPELLLMRVDKMCMAASLEARVPFLDIEMVKLTTQFGQESKIPGRKLKHLLKQALRGAVPDDVLDRPKKGFGAPMTHWLRGPLGAHIRQRIAQSQVFDALPLDRSAALALIDAHRATDRDYAVYIWTLFNLAAWHDLHIAEARAA